MNQPGEPQIQETIAPEKISMKAGKGDFFKALREWEGTGVEPAVIKKKIILGPHYTHKGFLFYGKTKRATACFLVEYIAKKIGAFLNYLEEKNELNNGDTEEDHFFLRILTHEQVSSLWWERDYNERITTLRKDDEDHFERFIWEYGAYDATLLLPVGRRNKATGYEILDAIMRDCWECRHKILSSEKRKKIQEMTPATRAFYDGGDFTYDDDDF